jgi:small-conductance mechanosensitive channel
MDGKLAQLQRSLDTWNLTLTAAQKPDTPPDVLQNIRNSIGSLTRADAALKAAERDVLSLQNLITQDDRRIDSALDGLNQAERQILDRVLKRDSAPLWSRNVGAAETGSAATERDSLNTELSALAAYARRNVGLLVLHAALLVVLILAADGTRRSLRVALAHDPALENATGIFNSPASMAVALSMLAAGWIYPAPPRLLKAALTAVALIPATIILRRLVGRHFRPVPTMLLLFFFADHLRALLSGSALMSRGALLTETLAAIAGGLWTWRRLHPRARRGRFKVRRRALDVAVRLAIVALGVALAANVTGFLNLATLLANATLNSAYAAVLLFALLRVSSVALLLLLRLPPVGRLRVARHHRREIWKTTLFVLEWAAFLAWLAFTLQRLAVADTAWNLLARAMKAPLHVGSIAVTLGNVLAFIATIWAAVTISSLVRFFLEEEVYAHLSLPSGLPYAISRTLHYVILAGGFLAAVAALGFDMTKFTILVSAFGVGLGFGMQQIFNNFASGLILLFERPIKVGDVIDIGGATGLIQRIGIRATVLRTLDGSTVILPNGKLISDPVTNWTAGGHQRFVQVPVTVAAGTDPQRVLSVLRAIAARDPRISTDPPPQAVVTNVGPGGVEFQLRVWTRELESSLQVKSDLAVAVNDALQKEKLPA